jgi:ABC-type spermidine/putrescine transport system permease subunit II
MLLPGMVLGISLLLSFKMIGVLPGFLTIVVAHAVFLTPVVLFLVSQRLATLDPSLAQASLDLGASKARTFFEITFPLLWPAMLASALLGFTLSFDELAVTFFVAGFDQPLPVYVFSLLRLGFTPQVNAVFTILAVLSVIAVLAAGRVVTGGRRPAPRVTDEPVISVMPEGFRPQV